MLTKRFLRLLSRQQKTEPAANSFRFPNVADTETEKLLHVIPSQTTPAERRFLYHFFENIWSGEGDVVEIGPFLGGTTRCIALGMISNPRFSGEGKLYTYDRFQDYFSIEKLREYLMPAVERQPGLDEQIASLGDNARFLEIFECLHKENPYFSTIVPSDHGVPDLKEQVESQAWMQLPTGSTVSAVFIDGCKSWYGTKYFMQAISECVSPGAYFIFQDYGWYTCFWLPAFISVFSDYFRLVGAVDNTYTFVLRKKFEATLVEKAFPDEPAGFTRQQLVDLFDGVIADAEGRGDLYATARHTIHKAAAMAYIGEKGLAKSILNQLAESKLASECRHIYKDARVSPTYTPSGPIYLE